MVEDSTQFHVIPGLDWYEKQEMLDAAHAYGLSITESQLDDWIEKGLVGQAHREWLGRGRGSASQWPFQQFTLLLELLRGRHQGKLRIGQLCAFPVWRWVYWGELGGVSLSQVRRVMGTWVTSVKNTSPGTARKDARSAIEKVQGTRFSGKRSLLNELAAIGAFDKDADSELLRYLIEPVITTSPIRWVLENGEIRSGDVELLAEMLPIRQKAFQHYEQIAHLPDVLWGWARTFLLLVQLYGQSKQPLLARNRRLADRYRRLTIYDVLCGSCYDFLAPLSIAAQKLFPEEKDDPVPFLNPHVWQEGRASSRSETKLIHSPLFLPDGSRAVYLRNEIAIVYQEKAYQFTLDLPFI